MIWECECGNIEYDPIPPEECPKCLRIDSFTNLPEELIEERAKDKDAALEDQELPNILVEPKKLRSKPGKSKTRRRK